jgi:tetraacyldisaccharide 4'-kinase
MVSEAPPFWWQPSDWRAWALYPLSALYAAAARHRLEGAERVPVHAPVLCVGNFTVGGAGKTPIAIALAREARRQKLKPGFLSRGHGGAVHQPRLVDAEGDAARHVGDEPLVLARAGPTVVTPNRKAGAELLVAHGCDFIVMDDGFQSARIHMDFALIVVDSHYGIGNGHTIPGGPMRAPRARTTSHRSQEIDLVRGIDRAHITGGGLPGNLPRALSGFGARLHAFSWELWRCALQRC